MSAFMIFAILLTIAYIIYYAVVIYRDIYGKKIEKTSEDEVFEVEDMAEKSVNVRETKNGFVVGDSQKEPEENESKNKTAEEQSNDGTVIKEPASNPTEEKLNRIHNEMQEAEPQSELGMNASDLYDMLLLRAHKGGLFKPEIKIERNEY
jgi:hypothetical protein